MKILIDINHPADIHLFKNFVLIMLKRGHKILFTTREKEITTILLKKYGFKYISFGKNFRHPIKKIYGLAKYDLQLLVASLKFDPDIILNSNSIYACHVAFMLCKKHITFVDTDNATKQILLYKPFAKTILTPSCITKNFGNRQINYSGYHELAYLHPDYFIPDCSILNLLEAKKDDKYVIIRFVAWGASHDIGHKGISLENKIRAVKEFSKYAKVFISSEKELPIELKKYKINIPPEKMHDAIFYANLIYGESSTMASEAAVLGVPAIYLDNVGRRYTDEEESKYGLVFNYSESIVDQELSIKKGIELLQTNNLKQEWHIRRQKMLSEKIDVNSFMVWFVEKYPNSVDIMKKKPDYQLRFK